MNPKIWGPGAWLFIHSIAMGYPDNPSKDEQIAIQQFLNSLKYILPCKSCSTLYKKDLPIIEKIISLKDASQNKKNLIKWVNLMHNQVNKNINKKTYSDYEYETYYNNLYNKNETNKYFVVLIILFILCIIYIMAK